MRKNAQKINFIRIFSLFFKTWKFKPWLRLSYFKLCIHAWFKWDVHIPWNLKFHKWNGVKTWTSQCHIQSYFEAGIPVQDPKFRPPNVLVSGTSFHHCSLSQSYESDVLSYSECEIAKIFQGFAPGPHWGGITPPPPPPPPPLDLPSCATVFLLAKRKTGTPKKLLDTALLVLVFDRSRR